MDQQITTSNFKLPALGAPLENGVFAGISTNKDGSIYALIKLPDGPKPLNWKDCLAAAAEAGGDAPSRLEGLMLFLNLPEERDKDACWINEQFSGGRAWSQHFYGGRQRIYGKYGKLRAVFVRRLPFNPSILLNSDEQTITAA